MTTTTVSVYGHPHLLPSAVALEVVLPDHDAELGGARVLHAVGSRQDIALEAEYNTKGTFNF